MRTSRLTNVLLFSLSLLLALGFAFVKAEPAQAQEGAGIPLVKFEGVITEIEEIADADDVWTVDEQAVTVTDTTIIVETEGEAVVGAHVTVIAKKVGEDELEAILIRVKPAQATRIIYLAGMVESFSDEKVVLTNGKEIKITDGTQIEGTLAEDVYVLIKARFDGTEYEAIKIQVVDMPMQRIVEFDGVVESISEDLWEVAGYEVGINVDPYRTMIMGQIKVGDRVQVRAVKLQDNSLVALLIRKAGASWWPKMERFSGTIVELPETPPIGDWTINDGTVDRTVTVTGFTRVRGEPVVGATVHVTAWSFSTGVKYVAMEIKVQGDEQHDVTIEGTITKLPEDGPWGTWTIDEGERVQVLALREVLVLPGTEIEGLPEVGAQVKINGIEQPDGVVVAKDMEIVIDDPIEGIHLIGKITQLGEGYIVVTPAVPLWTIKVTYTPDVVSGTLAVGNCVAILARETGEREYDAIQITVVDCPKIEMSKGNISRTVD